MPRALATTGATEVVRLDAARALDPELVGSKAANLALARQRGFRVLDGAVLPVGQARSVALSGALPAELVAAYDQLSFQRTRLVVVRSSSPAEDGSTSSLAGRFTSVVGVADMEALAIAVSDVVASAGEHPMAVLVQPFVDPVVSGVLFGMDPVSGRTDRLVVAVVAGGPQALVSGAVSGDRYVLDRHGRIVDHDRGEGGAELRRSDRRALARLAARAAQQFGSPQDIEWARTDRGVVLLQARPVTASSERPRGPRYGTGPVGETFPRPLGRLEQELWLPPMRDAIADVLVLTGRSSRRRVERRALVVSPGGRPAVDLELAGEASRPRLLSIAGMGARARRLRSAWRVGRLTVAVDVIAGHALRDADHSLAEVPELGRLDDRALLRILERGPDALRSLHGLELLAGALGGNGDGTGSTGAGAGLFAMWEARGAGTADAGIVARRPEVLALSPPHIGPAAPLPLATTEVPRVTLDGLAARESLRLRARWVHELTARTAWELGRRLAMRGLLRAPEDVRDLQLADLRAAIADGVVPMPVPSEAGPPLPAVFRLTADGSVVAEDPGSGERGVGAGGGRGVGAVYVGDAPPPGAVLVTAVLEPQLASHLPQLGGLIAETGSPLSHLAILAREYGVPIVVGFPAATRRWRAGDVVLVDGTTGVVERAEVGS